MGYGGNNHGLGAYVQMTRAKADENRASQAAAIQEQADRVAKKAELDKINAENPGVGVTVGNAGSKAKDAVRLEHVAEATVKADPSIKPTFLTDDKYINSLNIKNADDYNRYLKAKAFHPGNPEVKKLAKHLGINQNGEARKPRKAKEVVVEDTVVIPNGGPIDVPGVSTPIEFTPNNLEAMAAGQAGIVIPSDYPVPEANVDMNTVKAHQDAIQHLADLQAEYAHAPAGMKWPLMSRIKKQKAVIEGFNGGVDAKVPGAGKFNRYATRYN